MPSSALLIIGAGLPVSMRIAAGWAADAGLRGRLDVMPGDADLAAKVGHQITRITVVMCGALVPGTLLFIAYDIQAGPIITILRWVASALVLASIAHTAVRRPR